ncbi:MAG: AI-2E family transporter, partial [Clostridia bacterium]
ALIPVIGAWMGCIVGALLILISNPMQALGFLALFLVLQQLEGNLIYPHVMGNAIGLPSLWVLFAVVLGQGLMGILGMLLFIPLTSVGYTLLREKVNERLKERELAREV